MIFLHCCQPGQMRKNMRGGPYGLPRTYPSIPTYKFSTSQPTSQIGVCFECTCKILRSKLSVSRRCSLSRVHCWLPTMPPVELPRRVLVALDTTEGKIVIELDAEKAPKTVANFLDYVMSGHYEGTVFHRVIKDFMIQGGGMDENLKEKEVKAPVRNEAGNGLKNNKYTVAMARTNDPHSATSQFFINTADNGFLNREQAQDGFGYTVFGKVVEGMDVVDKIGVVKTVRTKIRHFPRC